ncbi:MAG: hypothetical protein AVDCRST_MAG67-1603, partial [uncultured Solirubrobacteraceae bacterium]
DHGAVADRAAGHDSRRGRQAVGVPAARPPRGLELPARVRRRRRQHGAAGTAVLLHRPDRRSERAALLRRRADQLLRVRARRHRDHDGRRCRHVPRGSRVSQRAAHGHPRGAPDDADERRHDSDRLRRLRPGVRAAADRAVLPCRHAGRRRRRQRGGDPAGHRGAAVLHPVRVGPGHPLRGVHGDVQGGRRRLRRVHPHDDVRGLLPALGAARLAGAAIRAEPDDPCGRRDARDASGAGRMVGGRRRAARPRAGFPLDARCGHRRLPRRARAGAAPRNARPLL